ncbi:MAG: MATE family efflux transporter [Bradyrhizobium sp.]|nr:MATE family efflux transporter [Bradyrhizobium sp.]
MDLTTGPVTRVLVLFSIPVLLSSMLQSLSGSINAIWVGRYLGEAALTATANANLILFFLLGVVFGVGMAATILVGQSVGARNIDRAKRVIGTTATFFVVASLIIAGLGYAFTPEILRLMDTPPSAQPLAEDYLRIIFLAVPPFYFQTLVMMVLRGSGDSRTPLIFTALTAALDAGLNPFLIAGIGPFPALGIAGAAIATLISVWVSLAAMLVWIYARRFQLRLTGPELAYLRPDPVLLRATVTKGSAMGLQMIVISGSAIVMMGLVNGYGVTTAAAYGVTAQLWAYVQMPAMAIGAAVSSMAAQNVGAGKWDRIERIARSGVMVNVAMTGLLAVALLLLDPYALRLFLPGGGEAVTIAKHINDIVVWTFIPFGATIVLFGVVRATGAVTPPLIVLFVSMVVVRIPFAEAMMPYWGADAIWWSFALGSLVSVTLTVSYYRWGGWRNARMTPPGRAVHAPDAGMASPAAD